MVFKINKICISVEEYCVHQKRFQARGYVIGSFEKRAR